MQPREIIFTCFSVSSKTYFFGETLDYECIVDFDLKLGETCGLDLILKSAQFM